MRKPRVENKYNLDMKKIRELQIGDESKIGEPLFWRNNIIHAWCISKSLGTGADRLYGADNEIWVGIYDKPHNGKRFHVKCYCYGGMCSYNFTKFFDENEIECENDLKAQEELLEIIHQLLEEGILVLKNDL